MTVLVFSFIYPKDGSTVIWGREKNPVLLLKFIVGLNINKLDIKISDAATKSSLKEVKF
jgi:hypothetical protein